jgi:arylsulfatase A-like enzyme
MRITKQRIFQRITFAIVLAWSGQAGNLSAESPRHVVVVVWDGMRPDFVTEQNTPTLWKMAERGVTFRNHHAVYLSATNVNGTAIATGDYPNHTGIIANHEFRPKIDGRKSLDVEAADVVARGDAVSGGKYIAMPTIAELIRHSGGRTIIAASKTVGLLHDRNLADSNGSITFFAGHSLPNESLAPLVTALGPFPKQHPDQDNWTTKALTEVLWKNGLPAYSLLWLGEPDLTQHETAPGAPEALRAVKSSDDNLAAVLAAINQQHAGDSTDVFVVSDHGFSTIEHEIELPKILRDAGFDAVTEFKDEPKAGQIMMVGVGGSVLFYFPQHDAALVRRLVEFLQQSSYAGVIFTKEKMEGTFLLEQAKIDSADAPEVVMSFRWDENKNQFGVSGMIDADWQRAAGKGTHATLSRFDMHNTLIAAGPDFQKGLTSNLPSGNVDLAPTILKILGIAAPPMDGRVLSEAMIDPGGKKPPVETKTLEATRKFSSGSWKQTLQVSKVGSTIYLDQGNAAESLTSDGN